MLGNFLGFGRMRKNKIFFCFWKEKINLKFWELFFEFWIFFLNIPKKTMYFNTGYVFYSVNI